MPVKKGFDSGKYLKEQAAAILERVKMFNNTLYLGPEKGYSQLFFYGMGFGLGEEVRNSLRI